MVKGRVMWSRYSLGHDSGAFVGVGCGTASCVDEVSDCCMDLRCDF
jgi:hypothetical protein